jgi:hypothetical protein
MPGFLFFDSETFAILIGTKYRGAAQTAPLPLF